MTGSIKVDLTKVLCCGAMAPESGRRREDAKQRKELELEAGTIAVFLGSIGFISPADPLASRSAESFSGCRLRSTYHWSSTATRSGPIRRNHRAFDFHLFAWRPRSFGRQEDVAGGLAGVLKSGGCWLDQVLEAGFRAPGLNQHHRMFDGWLFRCHHLRNQTPNWGMSVDRSADRRSAQHLAADPPSPGAH